MIKLSWKDLALLGLTRETARLGHTFESNMLDQLPAVFRIVEITSAGVQVERVRWVPLP